MKKSETSPGAARSRGPTDSKIARILWDVALFVAVVAIFIGFLQHNGFVGQGGIQPFPY